MREKIRCSVVGLAAELRIARHLATETGGTYGVCLDDTHLRDLVQASAATLLANNCVGIFISIKTSVLKPISAYFDR